MSRKDKNSEVDETKKSKKKKSKHTGIGVAIFFLFMIVLFIIFLVKYPLIKSNIEVVMSSRYGNPESAPVTEIYNSADDEIPQQEDKTLTIKIAPEKKTETPAKPENTGSENKASEAKDSAKEEQKKPAEETKPAENAKVTEVTTKVTYTELQLCFVEIDSEGAVSRKMIKRSIPKNDSPLSTAIKLLLEGPDTTKAGEKNCETLIPAGTKLLSAKVQGGIAYLNFNDKFNYNEAGIAGSVKQLEQIVYTATNFPTVNGVQFLIEGEKQRVLEGAQEGLNIDVPLSRASFK